MELVPTEEMVVGLCICKQLIFMEMEDLFIQMEETGKMIPILVEDLEEPF